MSREHYLFITGRLAEPALREVVADLGAALGFDYSIQVMPITVAALMTPKWIARRIRLPAEATRVIIPGYCHADLTPLEEAARAPVEVGPRDLRQLPEYFGRHSERADYGQYQIQIVAEIHRAPRLSLPTILERAKQLVRDGADVIHLDCEPRSTWGGVREATQALVDQGYHVSLGSHNAKEIAPAVTAGAELVLSVNKTNRRQACDWGCEVVAVPDVPGTLEGLDETVEILSQASVACRIDPLLSPIGFGLAASLGRFLEVRNRWPDAEMLMGIGTLTQLTDVDSAGINVLLLGFCQEIAVHCVLTNEDANWARSCVRECHLARQLVDYAVTRRVLPKHLEPGLVMLRDVRLLEHSPQRLLELAQAIKDHSFRIFAEQGRVHVITSDIHLQSDDPFDLFEQLLPQTPTPIDPSHAFYLGYEMAKAMTALTLGKNYCQDEALDWGMLTRRELSRLERRAARLARRRKDGGCEQAREETCD